ncbi:MAG: homoprotocatechuate degradation operon regulator HpaR [Rhizobiales bacterium]|jgi:homoprotocatechuate degradation regulator HpaR|nr:homoprotocatechuate degradation operon regulator HpaR [Hyphomicrobiales bacterium]
MSVRRRDSAQAMRPFARSLPMQLLRAREVLMQEFRPHLRKQGLSEQQWRVLRALAEAGSMDINALGEMCQIHPASLSRMLPNLEDDGRIERRASPDDQRYVIVSITAKGKSLFQRMARESEQIYASIERRIGSKELKLLYELLDRAIHVAGEQESN